MADPVDQLVQLQGQFDALLQQFQALQAQAQPQAQPQAAPVAAPAAPGFKVKQPDTYDGRKTPVDLWIFQVQQYFNAVNLTDNERAVYYATNLLRGDAATWWRMRYTTLVSTTPITPLPTWPEFQQQLIAQFKPVNFEKIARDKLARLRQTSSVRAYNSIFMSTVLEINNISEYEKLDRYTRGLKDRVRQEV